MMTSKQVWLASAALLAGVTGGQAADLPFRKAAPVEYVRVCDAFGEGFFYIPGTDTCLRMTGQIRAEYTIRGGAPTNNSNSFAVNQAGQVYERDLTSFRARGYLNADARTQTAYGTLRTFVSFRINKDTTEPGPFGGRGSGATSSGPGPSTGAFQGISPNSFFTTVDKGFIQFAGLTAGRAQSFFDFDAQSYELLTNSVVNSNQVTELLAYTYTFGGGFSGTLSVEDRNERTIADNGSFVFSNVAAGGVVTTAPLTGNINNPSLGRASVLAYAGESVPDIVADVRYDGGWGSAQLSAAYHQVQSIPVTLFNGAGGVSNNTTTSRGVTVTPSADGFAAQAGIKILLPMLAKGDSLTLQGTYERGAFDYADPIDYQPNGLTNVYDTGTNGLQNQFGVPVNDAFILPNGKVGLNEAYGGYLAFRHYFVPTVYGSLYGDYLQINNPLEAQRLGTSYDNARIFQVGGNLVYTPIKDLQIGGEVLYTDIRYEANACGLLATAANCGGATGAGLGTTPQNPSDIRGRLSIRRAF